MGRIIAKLKNAAVVSFLLAAIIFALVLGLRQVGILQPLELLAYDYGVKLKSSGAVDNRLAMIGLTEADIHALGYPASDELLAKVLERLTQYQARTIGVDIYRDMPVPPGSERLASILKKNQNIIWITQLGEKDGRVLPPKALEGSDQVGFNDMIADPGGKTRKGLLFMDDGKNSYNSFALQLALRYLEPQGIGLQPDPENKDWVRLGKTTIRPFSRNDGGYADADDAGYQFLLDYSGMPKKFQRFSFGDLLNGNVDPSLIKDRIVIVGATANSVNDFFYTPFSEGAAIDQRIYGIELHGYSASQLVRFALDGDKPISTFGKNIEWAWIWLWVLLGAAGGYFTRALWQSMLSAALALLVLALAYYQTSMASWWIPVIPPALGYLLAAGVVTSYMSSMEKKQRNLLMNLFSKHVSKDVAEAVWKSRDDFMLGNRPRPQKLVATVLFTDIQGFTTISESMDPETLMNWLNEYMEAMAQIVIAHQGVINKYIGDAIMAVFGVPIARSGDEEIGQDAENAVDCALAMSREIVRLNSLWAAQGKAGIAMRVGIYTGPLVAGSVGSSDRLEYTVIGDTVNIASRLESYDKSKNIDPDGVCRILVGATTHEVLHGKFVAHPIGAVALKGKEKEIEVFQITGRLANDKNKE